MSEFQVGQIVEALFMGDWREGKLARENSGGFDVELAGERLMFFDASSLRPAHPRAGDLVRVVSMGENSLLRRIHGLTEGHEGILTRLDGKNSTGEDLAGFGVDGRAWGACHLILLRRSGTPAAEEVRYYGTMPDPLPETLPAGTKWKNSHYEGEFTGAATLGGTLYGGSMLYRGLSWSTERSQESDHGHAAASAILWDSVPIQPSPAAEVAKGDRLFETGCALCGGLASWDTSADVLAFETNGNEFPYCEACKERCGGHCATGEEARRRWSLRPISPPPVGSAEVPLGSGADAGSKPAGGGSSVVRVDPYKKHAADLELLPDMQRIKMRLWFEKEDKLAASRRAKVEQATRDLDRPVSSHPRSFPERAFFDADELYPTY